MKRDINLIPRKSAGHKQSKGLVTIILVAVFYLVALLFAIIIPNGIKQGYVVAEALRDLQIQQLQPQVDEYNNLRIEIQKLQEELDSSGSMEFNKFDAFDALQILQETCPKGVRIASMKNEASTLVVDIVAENNYQIAKFALELQRTGNFTVVNISGSAPTTIIQSETEQAYSESGVLSTIYLLYDLSEPEPEEATDEAAPEDTAQEGGN